LKLFPAGELKHPWFEEEKGPTSEKNKVSALKERKLILLGVISPSLKD